MKCKQGYAICLKSICWSYLSGKCEGEKDMNNQEAIEAFKGCDKIIFKLTGVGEKECDTTEFIGVVEALEKATPKEPTIIKLDSKIQIGSVTFNKDCTVYKCQCEKFIKYKQIYCDVCGQHLKWEE